MLAAGKPSVPYQRQPAIITTGRGQSDPSRRPGRGEHTGDQSASVVCVRWRSFSSTYNTSVSACGSKRMEVRLCDRTVEEERRERAAANADVDVTRGPGWSWDSIAVV
jgi:hypothetical protein